MPCIVVLLAVLLGAGSCAATVVRAEEAARLAARSAARGDSAEQARQAAVEVIGAGAEITLQTDADRARVRVTVPAPGVIGQWGGVELSAEATTPVEHSGSTDAAGTPAPGDTP